MSRLNQYSIFCEILQNGAPQACFEQTLGKTKIIKLGTSSKHDIQIPFYPMKKTSKLFKVGKNSVTIFVHSGMKGFAFIDGKGKNVENIEKSTQTISIKHGDCVSLEYEGLTCLYKVNTSKSFKDSKQFFLNSEFRASPLSCFINSKDEWRAVGIAALSALGLMVLFLLTTSYVKPKTSLSFKDMDLSYRLQFINSSYLLSIPEATQEYLNRTDYVGTTINYYDAVVSMMSNKSLNENYRFVYPSSIKYYEKLYRDLNTNLDEKIKKQRLFETDILNHKTASLISIPIVYGESVFESTSRILDKVSIMQNAFDLNLKERKNFVASYKSDQVYDYEKYVNKKVHEDKKDATLARIKPFTELSEESVIYRDAAKLAQVAKRYEHLRQSVSREEIKQNTISVLPGSDFVSIVENINLLTSNKKINTVLASEFGTTKARVIKEPLVGQLEPHLIEKVIDKNRYELRLCYELALKKNRGIKGETEWSWRISSRGKISDLKLVNSTINDQNMLKCIRQKIANWTFPRPKNGSVEVRYPFNFNTAQRG